MTGANKWGLEARMEVEFREEGERLVVQPRGHMDADAGIRFTSIVQQRLAAGPGPLTIDLDRLESIGLGGVRAILRLARSLNEHRTSLEFVRGDDTVREALHHAGMNNLFAFTPPYHSHRGTHS